MASKAAAADLLSEAYARRQAELDFANSGDANLPPAGDTVTAAPDSGTICADCEEVTLCEHVYVGSCARCPTRGRAEEAPQVLDYAAFCEMCAAELGRCEVCAKVLTKDGSSAVEAAMCSLGRCLTQ